MIRKFATVPGFRVVLTLILATILAGTTTVHAQQAPAQQDPTQQPPAQPQTAPKPSAQQPADQSGSQEATPEETEHRRKVKPRDYNKWSFNVGAGGSLTNGVTTKLVRGGGEVVAAGVARNFNKYFGFRADFQWDNLPLRDSALQLAEAPGATSHVYSFMLDPIINVPVNKNWGGYIVFGPAFYHRTGKLDSSAVVPGSACNEFWNWWGTCYAGSVPLNKDFLYTSQNQPGLNFGGGITRRIHSNIELYGEVRYLHGSSNGRTTDLRPITIGLRW
jgi:hypothetical protein